MVVRTALSPDPSNGSDENFLPANIGMIVASSSDSEGEVEISHEGYEVLPQELCETSSTGDDDRDNEEGSSDERNDISLTFSHLKEYPSFDQSTKSEVTELWNLLSSSRETDIVIDSTKEQQIKNAMAGFKLPPTSIPSWALEIPEEEWKEQLKNRVTRLNEVTTFIKLRNKESAFSVWDMVLRGIGEDE